MKYTEQQLVNWTNPLSKSEEDRASNTIKMIKDAIYASQDLKNIDIEVFLQGSYANNTNVKNDSDVDVCIMCKSTFFTAYPDGLTDKDYHFSEGSITFLDYKRYVLDAIKKKFGNDATPGNKSVKIKSNTYHVDADVVPSFMYKNFKRINSKDPSIFSEGVKLIADDGSVIINYPKIHLSNGINKNNNTNYRYKKLVRIVKHIKNEMAEKGIIDGDIISSFLVECLVWNFSNSHINSSSNYTDMLRKFLAVEICQMDRDEHKEWGEVSECLYLFHGHKWTDEDAKDFLMKAWKYCEYE